MELAAPGTTLGREKPGPGSGGSTGVSKNPRQGDARDAPRALVPGGDDSGRHGRFVSICSRASRPTAARWRNTVRASLRQAVTIDGQAVLPVGTELVGVVTAVERSGRVKGRASVAYRFDSLRYEDERYPVTTATISHEAEATKGEDATKIAIGAGAGAALGAILGGGDGAAKGAAIGGAAGTGTVLATRGQEVRLGPGANVTTRLTAPLMVRIKS